MRLLRSVQLKKQNVDLTSETKKKKKTKSGKLCGWKIPALSPCFNSIVQTLLVRFLFFFLKLRNWKFGYTRETTRKKLSEHLNYPNTETIHAGFAQQYKIEKCNVYLTILHSS